MVAPAPAGAPSCLPRPALTYRHFCRGCLRLFIVFAHLLYIRYLTGVSLHWSISWLFSEGLRFVFFWTLAFLLSCISKSKGKLTGFRLNLCRSISPRAPQRLMWTVSQCAPRMRGQHMSEMVSGSASAGAAPPVQGTRRSHPTLRQQLRQCCSQGISHSAPCPGQNAWLSSSFTTCRLWLLFARKVFAAVLTCSWVTLTQQ